MSATSQPLVPMFQSPPPSSIQWVEEQFFRVLFLFALAVLVHGWFCAF